MRVSVFVATRASASVRVSQDGSQRPITAQGVLLEPEVSPWFFHEEELPRSGLRVRRTPAVAVAGRHDARVDLAPRHQRRGRGLQRAAIRHRHPAGRVRPAGLAG